VKQYAIRAEYTAERTKNSLDFWKARVAVWRKNDVAVITTDVIDDVGLDTLAACPLWVGIGKDPFDVRQNYKWQRYVVIFMYFMRLLVTNTDRYMVR